MDRGQGKRPVSPNVTDFMIDHDCGQVSAKIERSIKLRSDSFSFAVNEKILACLAHPRHAFLEITCEVEPKRNHDIPGEIRIAPFAILRHHANSVGVSARQ